MATEDKRVDQLPAATEVDPASLLVVQRGAEAEHVSIEQLQEYLSGLIGSKNAVLYVEQTLTEEQRHQARLNIRCGSLGQVSEECYASSGVYAHAEGINTAAFSAGSHTEGKETISAATYAHAEGYGTRAEGSAQHVEGSYNIADGDGSLTLYSRGKYIHIAGNGIDENNRANAHTLDWDGVPWYAGDRVMLGGTGMDDENAVALMPIFAPQQLTEEQKQQARANIGAVQQYPFVDSVSQMTDIDKEYVLSSTGEIWRYQLIEQGIITTPNFTNLFDKSMVILNKIYNEANNPPEDWDGAFLTGPYAYDFTDYDVSHPAIVRIKGISLDDCFAIDGRWTRVAYYRYAVPTDMTTEKFRMYTQFNAHVPYTVDSDGTIAFPLIVTRTGYVGEYDLMQAFAFCFPISKSAITLNDVPDLIVTINEEITYTETTGTNFYAWKSTGEKYTDAYMEPRISALEKEVADLKAVAEETVFPNFSCENDFTIVGDEIWGSKNEDTYTRLVRHKILDGALVKLGEITLSDVIHLNTLDYCPENDCLITGNGANDQNTQGNCFWVIPNASRLPERTGALSLADIAIRYDVDIGYKVQAIWGNGNRGQHNLVYLLSNDRQVREAILHRNADGSFSGSYTIVSDVFGIENAVGFQGADYYNGHLYFGCSGDKFPLAKANTRDFAAEVADYPCYDGNGNAVTGVWQGVAAEERYLWLYPSGTTELIRLAR